MIVTVEQACRTRCCVPAVVAHMAEDERTAGRCIADGCMSWRPVNTDNKQQKKGYCGMAGTPAAVTAAAGIEMVKHAVMAAMRPVATKGSPLITFPELGSGLPHG